MYELLLQTQAEKHRFRLVHATQGGVPGNLPGCECPVNFDMNV